jgi:prefoldin subunit 5
MTTMVDVGSECFVQAKMFVLPLLSDHMYPSPDLIGYMFCREDTSKIFVNVGMGFHAEMTLDEALQFIATKEKELNAYVRLLC